MKKRSVDLRAVISDVTGGASLRDLGAVIGASKDKVSRELANNTLSPDDIVAIAKHWNRSPVRVLIEAGRLERSDVIWEAGAIALSHATDEDLAEEVLARMTRGRAANNIFAAPIEMPFGIGLAPDLERRRSSWHEQGDEGPAPR